jgi:polysaccharide export outer membrane protein
VQFGAVPLNRRDPTSFPPFWVGSVAPLCSAVAWPEADSLLLFGEFMTNFPPFLIGLILTLSACTEGSVHYPVTKTAQSELEQNVDIIAISAENIGGFTRPFEGPIATSLPAAPAREYRVGPGDVIAIFVFDHPELSILTGEDKGSTGFLVLADGTFTYPFIGSVTAAGQTVEEIRAEMARRLTTYFPDPQVDVRIAGFNSQRVVVGGEVGAPTTQSIQTTPLTLLEAINAAGAMTDEADPRLITVRRAGVNHRVDLDAFLSAGMAGNNPVLIGGDVVSVPKKRLREAYLLGEISTPATVDLSDDVISLTQAITRQGGLLELRADARGVFVFRQKAGRVTVYQLDVSYPTGLLLGTRFALEPMDVVYVTKSPLQRWNDTVTRILPSVGATLAAKDIIN